MVVVAFFLDISQLSFVLSLSNAYPCCMITCCLVLDKGLDLGPFLCLAEEMFLLGLHFQSLMTRLLPWITNLYALVSTYLSSDDLISSHTAHGPTPISEPFIPTYIHTYIHTYIYIYIYILHFRIGDALIGRFRFGLDQKIIKEKTITILV